MGASAEQPGSPVDHRSVALLPTTRLGWWAAGLAAAFLPLVLGAGLVPRAAALGLLCGLAGGAAALVAILRDRERAIAVFAAVVPLAIVVAFALAELLGGSA